MAPLVSVVGLPPTTPPLSIGSPVSAGGKSKPLDPELAGEIEKIPGIENRSIGEELLEPTRIYVKPVLDLLKSDVKVSGLAHITGGAFSKMTRLVRDRDIGFQLNNMPSTPPLFELIQREGDISEHEMYRTFNMGIGFCVVAPSSEVNAVEKTFRKHKMRTHVIGKAAKGAGVYIGDVRVD